MRGKHLLRAALAAALVLGSCAPAGAGGFFFKNGDTVVVMGDSITEQHLYSNYLEAWTLLRYPAWKITFHNVGIGGDTSGGGNGRFARDVLEYKPTALTVDFGMNDGGYGGFVKSRFDAYMNGLGGIAKQARAANPANRVGGGDAVHFGPPGQAVMAAAILKGLGFPTLVAAVELDAAGKVLKSDNCKITGASAVAGGLK
ncbi:MAG: GDSL-type esterase/lipase family protein, partial [Planctomycetota bacterium]|nr:GDSL-type esterase/lipase family protein [Planctomycetota bacterium]